MRDGLEECFTVLSFSQLAFSNVANVWSICFIDQIDQKINLNRILSPYFVMLPIQVTVLVCSHGFNVSLLSGSCSYLRYLGYMMNLKGMKLSLSCKGTLAAGIIGLIFPHALWPRAESFKLCR